MTFKLILSLGAFVLIGGSATAQAADQPGCQERADKVARAVGVPTSPVSGGTFFVQKGRVATVYGDCQGSLTVSPDPEPFDQPLSSFYPGLVVHVTATVFDLQPAEVTRAIEACLNAAKPDPLSHSGRAGFARQRWRNSQMTGSTMRDGLTWECTYHNSERRAASVTISKGG